MKNKEEKITFILTLPYEAVTIENVLGQQALVSYALRMYHGPTKVNARMKFSEGLVEVNAYGLVVVRSLEFDHRIPDVAARKLKDQGYNVVNEFNMAILNKDFGYLTSQNYELNYLIHRLLRSEIPTWDNLCKAVYAESATWGEAVIDVHGRLVYIDEEQKIPLRDPFAKAGRLALKKKIYAERDRLNPIKTVKNFFSDIGKDNDKGEGVDM